MSITKYKTKWSKNSIERVEVLRETEAFVYVSTDGWTKSGKGERRQAKLGEFAQYHNTWADAHAYLMADAENSVTHARSRLEQAKGHLGNIKGMKPPKEAP